MMLTTNPQLTAENKDLLLRQKTFLQQKINELITFDGNIGFCPAADPYVKIATSHLQIALNEINKVLYVEG